MMLKKEPCVQAIVFIYEAEGIHGAAGKSFRRVG